MEENLMLSNHLPQNIKNLFTYQDTRDGYQKRKEERHGPRRYQDILISLKNI